METEDEYEVEQEIFSPRSNALTKLSVLIGNKNLNFKVVDKSEYSSQSSFPKNRGATEYVKQYRSRLTQAPIAPDDDPAEATKRAVAACRKRGAISNFYTMAPPAPPRDPIAYVAQTGSGVVERVMASDAGLSANAMAAVSASRGSGSSPRRGDDAEFNCMFCGCCFETADQLTEHEPLCAAGETDSMNISCHCGRTFINIDALDSHSKVHEIDIVPIGSANFHCRYCGKSFGTALSLATHEAVHSSSMKPFRCMYCNRAFLKKVELQSHERIHNGDETPFTCAFCDKAFPSRLKLSRHEIMHTTGQRPFTCSYCGKTFSHHQSLQKHERSHTGEKPYQCPICTKCFAAQSNYDVHMKLHASGRRFFCSFCGKWFRTEHQMLEHQQGCLAQLHGQGAAHDLRPSRFQCSYCDKLFHYRRDQLIHERIHTGERPYTCGYCSKGFTQSQALTIHIRTHTGEKPYMCELCGSDFRDSSSLRKHEFIRHPNINPHFVGALPPGRVILSDDEDQDMEALPY